MSQQPTPEEWCAANPIEPHPVFEDEADLELATEEVGGPTHPPEPHPEFRWKDRNEYGKGKANWPCVTIRMSPHRKELLQRAAAIRGMNPTHFAREAVGLVAHAVVRADSKGS